MAPRPTLSPASLVLSARDSNQDAPWPQKLALTSEIPVSSASAASKMPMNAFIVSPATTLGPTFSLSALIHDQYWMSIVLCVIWIVTGLFLLFFGWASLFWGSNLGSGPKKAETKPKDASRLAALLTGKPLSGGVGGIVVGFLFFSFLATVVTAAICVKEAASISATSYFIIWLLPGLLGAFFAGHWAFFARMFSGLLTGACFTLVVTAMFGIRSLIIRTILISICTALITIPLIFLRRTAIHFHLLNLCTSIIGAFTFLDGVAVFAQPQASSDSWIDLWVLLFAVDDSSSQVNASKKWGTSAFKGFIAAAVLGAVVGFIFEFVFHKHAAEDLEMEWNNYLGSYTQRLEDQETLAEDRAGSFEPAPTAWQKFTRAFASLARPAAYGANASSHDPEKSPLTDLPGTKSRRMSQRSRSTKSRGGPAKFEALSKFSKTQTLEDSDDDDTDYDSDSSLHKSDARSMAVSVKSKRSKPEAYELSDELGPLSPSGDSKFDFNKPGRLLRPPSYRTNSGNSRGSASSSSGLSGSTAISPTSPTRPTNSRTTTMSPPPSFPTTDAQAATPVAPSVPATPSLVNAIARIQAAQAQARAWYESRQKAESAATKSAFSDRKKEEASSDPKLSDGDQSTPRVVPSSGEQDAPSFSSWWGQAVKGDSTKTLA